MRGRFAMVVAVAVSSAWLAHGCAAAAALGDRVKETSCRFLRMRRDGDSQPLALQTAIASHVSADGSRPGLVVDLIAAVHIGDATYYRQLNQLFRSYDVVLYELVAPAEAATAKREPGTGHHPVSLLQRGMKTMLELEFQLDGIDYTADNFVHADMSPAEFSRSMRDRGESLTQMFFRAYGQALASQSGDASPANELRMLTALFAPDRPLRLKRLLAEQFESMGTLALGLDGPEGSTILTQRNKRALSVLAKQIELGHVRIGIFYGAAHMPDMQRRLVRDFRLRRSGLRWVTAWDLTASKP